MVTRLCLINTTRGNDLTSEPRTLKALQNAFILIYCREIYPYHVYILFMWKSTCSRGYCFYEINFFIYFNYFHRFSSNQVVVNLDPTVVLVWGFNEIKMLMDLRNRIFCTLLVWLLFCLIRLYVALHFPQFLLGNQFLPHYALLLVWSEHIQRLIVLLRGHSRLLVSIQRFFSVVINYHALIVFYIDKWPI